MKVKTSITLSGELLKIIDRQLGHSKNRSEFIERALRTFIGQITAAQRDAHDLDIINRTSDRLNREASDVLEYQVLP